HRAEEGARLDAALRELPCELVARKPEAVLDLDRVHPVDVPRPGELHRSSDPFDVLEQLVVRLRNEPLPLENAVDLPELRTAERGLHARETEVVARLLVVETGSLEGEVAKQPQALGQRRVLGDDHAALAGRDHLVGVEAEAGEMAERPDPPAPDGGAVRLGAVLDHGETVTIGDLEQPIHVDGVTEEVHRDDRARPLDHEGLDQVEIEVPGDRLGVDRHRNAAVAVDTERSRDVRASADQDLGAGLEAERAHSELERRGAARHGDAVRGADVVRELALERGQILPERARDLPGPHGGRNRLDVLLVDDRLVDRDHAAGSVWTTTLSWSSPRNGPCVTLIAWKSYTTRIACAPCTSVIASPVSSLTVRKRSPSGE